MDMFLRIEWNNHDRINHFYITQRKRPQWKSHTKLTYINGSDRHKTAIQTRSKVWLLHEVNVEFINGIQLFCDIESVCIIYLRIYWISINIIWITRFFYGHVSSTGSTSSKIRSDLAMSMWITRLSTPSVNTKWTHYTILHLTIPQEWYVRLLNAVARSGPPRSLCTFKRRAIECIKLFLFEYKMNVNQWLTIQITLKKRCYIHIVVCNNGNVDCVKLLIEHKAKAHAKDEWLCVIMYGAASRDDINCIDLLIKVKAEVKDRSGETPLHVAIKIWNAINIYFLEAFFDRRRVDVNVQSNKSKTPLHNVVKRELFDSIEILLNKGVTKRGISVLNMIVRKTPSWPDRLCRYLESTRELWDDRPRIKLNFEFLIDCSEFGEIDLLKCFQKEDQYELLNHPVRQASSILKCRDVYLKYMIRLLNLLQLTLLYKIYVYNRSISFEKNKY